MTQEIPRASLWNSIVFNLLHIVPFYLQGIFTRNRFWVTVITALHPDPMGVAFVERLRKKLESPPCFYIYMLNRKTLWLLDRSLIQRVLDLSPAIYAEPGLKRRGMSHFQPDAVTISRGKNWTERRSFNEAVLASEQRVPPYAGSVLQIVSPVTKQWLEKPASSYKWKDFERLLEQITLQVIIGKGTTDNRQTDELKAMMLESNRIFGLGKSAYFDSFYNRMRTFLKYPRADSLIERCTHATSSEQTRVESQITHWIFAMKDTLAENVVRTLVLIAAHPDAMTQVRAEICAGDLDTTAGIDGLGYLEGCVQEGMRLWPTTALLLRESIVADVLGEHVVPAGTNILINNSFNHRDSDSLNHANTFNPEFWLGRRADYRLNHLSNGAQVCAGKNLVLFLAKAVLGHMLREHQFALVNPQINLEKPLPYRFNHFSVVLEKIVKF